ncbi:hypothetical protein H1Q59_01500 [Holosporaceae bacterium 'Namur']|nr:hypothetical protein [Holosporaceae bacterium 'Namur']
MTKINIINKAKKLACMEKLNAELSKYGNKYYDYLFCEVNNFNCSEIKVYKNSENPNLSLLNNDLSSNFNIIFKNKATKNYDYKNKLFPLMGQENIRSLNLLDNRFAKEKVKKICSEEIYRDKISGIKDFIDNEIDIFVRYFQNKAFEKDSGLKYKKALDNKLLECKKVSESIDYYDILKGMCLKLTFADLNISLGRLTTCNYLYEEEGYFDNAYYNIIENILNEKFQIDNETKNVFEQLFPQHTDEL